MIATEYEEQVTLIELIKLYYPFLANHTIHIPNQRQCTIGYGAKLKKMGVLPGVPDLFIAWPTIKYYGLWLELKSKKGKATALQLEFIERMRKVGFYGCVAYGADEAFSIIKDYLNNEI